MDQPVQKESTTYWTAWSTSDYNDWMSRKNSGQMSPERHAQLMDAALREFSAAGYEQASLNRIIRQCGLSKSSFYHFYAGKEALFGTLVQEKSHSLRQLLQISEAGQMPFWTLVEAMMEQLGKLTVERPDLVQFGRMLYQPDLPAGEGSVVQRVLDEVTRWLATMLETGQSQGAVRDDLPLSLLVELTFAVLQALDRWSLQHVESFTGTSGAEMVQQQLGLLRRMLEPG